MKKIKIISAVIIIIVLLLLDFAAIHDIAKGLEPDYYLEYFVLAKSSLIFVLMCIAAIQSKKQNK
ncbi:MAG: hypothetical protein GF349_00880 [Candidatus Magasanikbacteria bacterium]|nr:hypothetical protein [Candidatus Magasanikbacteria bacterium]